MPDPRRTWTLTDSNDTVDLQGATLTLRYGDTGRTEVVDLRAYAEIAFVGLRGDDRFSLRDLPDWLTRVSIDGGLGDDRLTGGPLWRVSGDGSGQLSGLDGSTDLVAFQGIEEAAGRGSDDRIVFTGDGARLLRVAGTGRTTLDFSALGGGLGIRLSGDDAGQVERAGATPLRFSGVAALVGGAGADRLLGLDHDNAWVLDGADAGRLNGRLAFAGIETLVGGQAGDRFEFDGGDQLSGQLDGGGGVNQLAWTLGDDNDRLYLDGNGLVHDFATVLPRYERIDELQLDTAGGDDFVMLTEGRLDAGRLRLATGTGDDQVFVIGFGASPLDMQLDAGGQDDLLSIMAIDSDGASALARLAQSAVASLDGQARLQHAGVRTLSVQGQMADEAITVDVPSIGVQRLQVFGAQGHNRLAFDLGDGDDTLRVDAGTLRLGALDVDYQDIAELTLRSHGGRDQVEVLGTGAGQTWIDTGTGADAVQVDAAAGVLQLELGDGDDRLALGEAARGLGGLPAAVQVDGGDGHDALDLLADDGSGDALTGRLGAQQATGLGLGGTLAFGGVESLALHLGAGDDQLDVDGTPAETTVDAGAGADLLRVHAASGATRLTGGEGDDRIAVLAAAGSLRLDGGAGNDRLRLGGLDALPGGGRLAGLQALTTVLGGDGADRLELDDSANTAAVRGSVAAAGLSGFGLAAGFGYEGLEALQLSLGSGADSVTVAGTHAGLTALDTGGGNDAVIVAGSSGALWLATGAGSDTLSLRANGGALWLDAGAGDDVVNLGAPGRGSGGTANTATAGPGRPTGGTVNALSGRLTLQGGGGLDLLFVDDTGDTAANAGTLGADSLDGLGLGQGLGYAGFEQFSVKLGSGADAVLITGTHAGQTWVDSGGGADRVTLAAANQGALTLATNAGNDQVDVRASQAPLLVSAGVGDDLVNLGSRAPSGGGLAATLAGPITVQGDLGKDRLGLDDSGNSRTLAYQALPGSLTGLGMAVGVAHTGIEQVLVTPARPMGAQPRAMPVQVDWSGIVPRPGGLAAVPGPAPLNGGPGTPSATTSLATSAITSTDTAAWLARFLAAGGQPPRTWSDTVAALPPAGTGAIDLKLTL